MPHSGFDCYRNTAVPIMIVPYFLHLAPGGVIKFPAVLERMLDKGRGLIKGDVRFAAFPSHFFVNEV